MPNKMIIFDLVGAYAMFRKFYTNSSSLSYPFPPRTVLAGLIAGVMGYERQDHRNTYADHLAPGVADIALSVRVPVRRVMQTVNYVMTEGNVWAKNAGGFDGSRERTLTPVEWVFPVSGRPQLRYRVYLTHRDEGWLERFAGHLRSGAVYPPYLGMTECPAVIEPVAEVENWEFEVREQVLPISTVINAEKILELPLPEPDMQIVKERMPIALDNDRRLLQIGNFVYEQRHNRPINAKVSVPVFTVTYTDLDGGQLTEHGVFMSE